jgi:hypothetical protein
MTIRNMIKATVLAIGVGIGVVIYGVIAHPTDLAVIWIDKAALVSMGVVIGSTIFASNREA